MKLGVLALQGGFREHREAFERLGQGVVEVRVPADLIGVDALVIPGGESSVIGKLLRSSGLVDSIGELPIFGTCAGMIISASEVLDGVEDQLSLGRFDARVRRNGIGPQRFSFETQLEVDGAGFVAVFIRPPVVEEVGSDVEVLATVDGRPVLCAQGASMFATFHPELSGDDRIHQLFLERLRSLVK